MKLQYLGCHQNYFTEVDVSNNPQLEFGDYETVIDGILYCYGKDENTDSGLSGESDEGKSQKSQSLTIKTKSKTIKFTKLRNKNQSFKLKATAKTAITFKKKSGHKKISVASNGKITVKKGLGKGTYKLKVKAVAKADDVYRKAAKTVMIKIKVK